MAIGKSIISADDIMDYIPQRPPIIMIDEFFGIDGDTSVSGLTINKENIFVEDDFFIESGLIEHVAQSAAMRMGYMYKNKGKNIPLGYIASINKFRIYELPKVGNKLKTKITIGQEFMNMSLVSVMVQIKEKIIVEGQMKIYLQE